MDTFKRYRTGGEQKVTVHHQHVSVTEGGRAIVNVTQTERETAIVPPSPAALANFRVAPMEIIGKAARVRVKRN